MKNVKNTIPEQQYVLTNVRNGGSNMIQVKFKNLDKSEIAKELVIERVEALVEKFEDLAQSRIVVTLEMENSPLQAGPDLFNVKLHIPNGRYKDVTVTKSDANLYKALADMVDHMLEILNRTGDKDRVKGRAKARDLSKFLGEEIIE